MKKLLTEWLKSATWGTLLLVCAMSLGHAAEGTQNTSDVPQPNVTAIKGGKCVENTEFMRKNHMKLLMHHRITAVHKGDNQLADKYSIVNCVNCHANPKDNSVVGPGDFCQSCHAYAAVKITCFECHSSKPSATPSPFHATTSMVGSTGKDPHATMVHYLAYHEHPQNLNAGLSAKDLAGVTQ
jgi:hypothetical protein